MSHLPKNLPKEAVTLWNPITVNLPRFGLTNRQSHRETNMCIYPYLNLIPIITPIPNKASGVVQ